MGYGIFMDNRWINMGLLIGYVVGHFVHSNLKLFPWLENPYLALAALAEEDNRGAPAAAPRREAPAAAADDPAATRAEGPVALKIGDAVTFAFPDTSANAPLSGQRGVVEALPGGEYPDRYVVFVAATADSDQRRLAVKREHLAKS